MLQFFKTTPASFWAGDMYHLGLANTNRRLLANVQ